MSDYAVVLPVEIVSGTSFEDAFWAMQNVARNMNCQVVAELNDVRISTHPRESFTAFVERYQRLSRKGAT